MIRSGISTPLVALRAGWTVFASRPISLVVAVVLAVVLAVVTLGLAALPALAGFYQAVRESRSERFFIDLDAVAGTARALLRGTFRHFAGGYVLGLLGLGIAVALLVTPALLLEGPARREALGLLLVPLCVLPAFFWAGAVLLFGYPRLVVAGRPLGALRHALAAGRRHPLLCLLVGALVLPPIPGALVHLLMVFSYPVLTAWALALGDAIEEAPLAIAAPQTSAGRSYWIVMLVALAAGGVAAWRWAGGLGVVVWLGLWLVFLILSLYIPLRSAAGIFAFAIGFTALMLGGGSWIARVWGESWIGPWIALCIVVLLVVLGRVFPR